VIGAIATARRDAEASSAFALCKLHVSATKARSKAASTIAIAIGRTESGAA
jgi:hypothetical protein